MTTAAIAIAYIRRLDLICRDRSRDNCVDDVCSLAQLRQLEISCLQGRSKVCNALVFSVAFHLAQLVQNLLGVASSISGNSTGILCVLITSVVDCST